jgi:hypothetical protein
MGQCRRALLNLRQLTVVCPTGFCTTVEDVTDLKGEHAERWQKWDSSPTRSRQFASPKTR